MRSVLVALAVGFMLPMNVRAADLRNFDDAGLHAIQFIDRDEGWAVGDEGVVWHTIDAGRTWERQPTGVRGSLRSVHFLNPYTGWIAGREELPNGGGSAGILLFTQDGGIKWRQASRNTMPGLNRIYFVDSKNGFALGDGSDQFPTGVFVTNESGRTWRPLQGPRCPGWLAADFQDAQNGALAGNWSRLATVRGGALGAADVDTLGGRSIGGLKIVGKRAVAVGQGGLVLLSNDTAGGRWGYADLGLPGEVQANWDFHGVYAAGDQIWAVGRPGTAVLHSGDQGKHWEIQVTGQPLPLNGVFFSDEKRGWAVGDFGSILATMDGGKNWQVQHRGGQRAAVLFVHAQTTGLPIDTVAFLGGQEGYLVSAVGVNCPDPGSAAFARASDPMRFAAAMRQAGGGTAELLWEFPVPRHLVLGDKRALLQSWDRLHADRAAEQLLRQLVLALRIWRPSVVITDNPDADVSGCPAKALIAEAIHEAFGRAADPKAFPEQIQSLHLEPWQPAKLYGRWETHAGAQVSMDLNEPSPRLESTFRDFAAESAGLLVDSPLPMPSQRFYRLLDSKIEGAATHRNLMDGITLPPRGVARRDQKPLADLGPNLLKAIRERRNLEAFAEAPVNDMTDVNKLLAQVGPGLKNLPDDQAAAAAFAVANRYVQMGQWPFARELFLLMIDQYPLHPLSADAARWLVRYSTSSEARRRQELGQFLIATNTEFRISKPAPSGPSGNNEIRQASAQQQAKIETLEEKTISILGNQSEVKQWYQGGLTIGDRLKAFGPLYATDPTMQFCLQAARRNLGELDKAREWYTDFCRKQPQGPWHDAAAAELWLGDRNGPPPKPVFTSRLTETRPFLDGKLDDACWQGQKPVTLRNAIGDTTKEYPTEAWLSHDKDFLYLALRCRHPATQYVAPVKVRPHDADLRPFDRVSLLLDLDRDYSTCFHLQVDQRGCVCDDCWGDRSWNPHWFVAVHSGPAGWQIEAAIPMAELTADTITVGRTWAVNVVRVLPGRGVQAFSTPADAEPRTEGLGLLLFNREAQRRKGE